MDRLRKIIRRPFLRDSASRDALNHVEPQVERANNEGERRTARRDFASTPSRHSQFGEPSYNVTGLRKRPSPKRYPVAAQDFESSYYDPRAEYSLVRPPKASSIDGSRPKATSPRRRDAAQVPAGYTSSDVQAIACIVAQNAERDRVHKLVNESRSERIGRPGPVSHKRMPERARRRHKPQTTRGIIRAWKYSTSRLGQRLALCTIEELLEEETEGDEVVDCAGQERRVQIVHPTEAHYEMVGEICDVADDDADWETEDGGGSEC